MGPTTTTAMLDHDEYTAAPHGGNFQHDTGISQYYPVLPA